MDIKETIETLNELSANKNLSTNDVDAINKTIKALTHIERRNGEQTDFQGWPIEKLTMKELRKFVRENGALHDEAKLLVLQDDGMGYGANNGYCSGIYVAEDENNETTVQIWF